MILSLSAMEPMGNLFSTTAKCEPMADQRLAFPVPLCVLHNFLLFVTKCVIQIKLQKTSAVGHVSEGIFNMYYTA